MNISLKSHLAVIPIKVKYKKYYLNIIKKLTVTRPWYSHFQRLFCSFFKENKLLVQYSLFRNQKKKERNEKKDEEGKRETERDIKEEKRIFGIPLSKFCYPT